MIELDTETGQTRRVFEHQTPKPMRAMRNASIVFKSGTVRGDRLYLTTETEVLILSLPEYKVLHHISDPSFNDVHHVLPHDGRLFVVSTGLDMVIEMDEQGKVLDYHPTLDEEPFARFDRKIDYRKVSTKPHKCHPNFVFELDGKLWVTRFHNSDAAQLGNLSQRIPVGVERIHDGNVYGGGVWFTAVSGHVYAADAQTHEQKALYDLNEIFQADGPLGWCRGLHLAGDTAYVGFSHLRPTKLHDNLRWIKGGGNKLTIRPTRVAAYNLARGELTREYILSETGIAAVFSVLSLEEV